MSEALTSLLVDGAPICLREIEGMPESDALAAGRRLVQLGLAVQAVDPAPDRG
jgi:hypothetical protein